MSESTSSASDGPKNAVFGIDLGTIRARAATVRTSKDFLRDTELIQDIPSVVSFTRNPRRCLVGSAAKRRVICSASNTFPATKYLLGRCYDDPVVQEAAEKIIRYTIHKSSDGHTHVESTNYAQIFTPGQITALILVKLKELSEEGLKIPIKNVIITTPAYFTDDQVQATKEAAQMAGLNVLKMINEHISACIAHGLGQTENKTVVVYDFGGTFKVSVLEIRNGEPEVKSTINDLFLSGHDFDDAIVDYLVQQLNYLTKVDPTSNPISMQWLRKCAEGAKMDLSYCTEVDVKFYIIRLDETPSTLIVKLTRTKFEELVVEFINKTVPLCYKALEDAKVSVSDIDEVFAIGGISLIPKVKSTVQEIFGKTPTDYVNCCRKEAVVYGAALEGYKLAANLSSDNLSPLEVSSHLPEPTKDTEELFYSIYDDDATDIVKGIHENGIIEVFTEDEADNQVLQNQALKKDKDEEAVKCIPAYQQVLRSRRASPEIILPDELQAQINYLRKKRADFVFEELRRSSIMGARN